MGAGVPGGFVLTVGGVSLCCGAVGDTLAGTVTIWPTSPPEQHRVQSAMPEPTKSGRGWAGAAGLPVHRAASPRGCTGRLTPGC